MRKGTATPEEKEIFIGAWNMLTDWHKITQDDPPGEWEALLQREKQLFKLGSTPAANELARRIANAILIYLSQKGG